MTSPVDIPGQEQDRAPREAQAWVVQLASGKMTQADERIFRAWHREPEHAEAFRAAKLHWDMLGAAAHGMAGIGKTGIGKLAAAHLAHGRNVSRRWFVGAGVAAAAAATGVVLMKPPLDLWSPVLDIGADFSTGIGETRIIEMKDKITVQLTTRSRMALDADRPDNLRVALLSGEAAVAAEARPVTVIAGGGETRAVNGRFNLRNDDGLVRVTCLAGTAEVVCGDQRAVLGADQQIRYGERTMGPARAVNPEEITAWQHGMLIFRDQPLRHVVEEVNRYRPGRIVLLNESLGSRPVAVATFHLDRLDDVVPQMEALYGAHARHLPGGVVLLS
jgi:transmembrane sensor